MTNPLQWQIVAVVDATPDRLVVSALTMMSEAARLGAGLSLMVFVSGAHQAACQRAMALLTRRGVLGRVILVREGDPSTWDHRLAMAFGKTDSESVRRSIDVSASTVGTAVQLTGAAERGGTWTVCWLDPGSQMMVDAAGTKVAPAIDVGRAPYQVTASEFLGVFGLQERESDPYGAIPEFVPTIEAAAVTLLTSFHDSPGPDGPYGRLRQLLRPAQNRDKRLGERSIESRHIPPELNGLIDQLVRLGFASQTPDAVVVRGPDDQAGVFLLSGGWLEIVTAMALRAALPEHLITMNLGTHWGHGNHTHAETDISFVYRNRIYLISCKNEFVVDRILQHFDRLRAVAAEFGESRVRAVVLSTSHLNKQQQLRCQAYEIGHLSGQNLIKLLHSAVVEGNPDDFRMQVLASGHRAPRPGVG